MSRVLRRMKACIDEFRPNTRQANYFEGLLRITSEINAQNRGTKTVRIYASNSPSRSNLAHILLKRSDIRPPELFAFKALLILINHISEFMFACF